VTKTFVRLPEHVHEKKTGTKPDPRDHVLVRNRKNQPSDSSCVVPRDNRWESAHGPMYRCFRLLATEERKGKDGVVSISVEVPSRRAEMTRSHTRTSSGGTVGSTSPYTPTRTAWKDAGHRGVQQEMGREMRRHLVMRSRTAAPGLQTSGVVVWRAQLNSWNFYMDA
jgi:hypothetical protein